LVELGVSEQPGLEASVLEPLALERLELEQRVAEVKVRGEEGF
jgi:hypothetical protein